MRLDTFVGPVYSDIVAYLHLENDKVPVYSANPWIESFADTVHDAISQQRSFYYTNDPNTKYFITSCTAQGWLKSSNGKITKQ